MISKKLTIFTPQISPKAFPKSTLGVFVFSLTLFSFFSPTVSALTPQERFEDRKEKMEQRFEEKKENLCERRTDRLNDRMSNFDNKKGKAKDNYMGVKEKLTTLVSNLKQKGYDTSKLEQDLTTWDTMIKDYAALKTGAWATKMQELKGIACSTDGSFATKHEELKTINQQLKQKREAIREYFKTTIKEDIKQVRAQKSNEASQEATN